MRGRCTFTTQQRSQRLFAAGLSPSRTEVPLQDRVDVNSRFSRHLLCNGKNLVRVGCTAGYLVWNFTHQAELGRLLPPTSTCLWFVLPEPGAVTFEGCTCSWSLCFSALKRFTSCLVDFLSCLSATQRLKPLYGTSRIRQRIECAHPSCSSTRFAFLWRNQLSQEFRNC